MTRYTLNVLKLPTASRLRLAAMAATIAALLTAGGLVAGAACAATPASTYPWNSPDAATTVFETPEFIGSFQNSSQTLVSLSPKGSSGFDFLPAGRFTQRLGDGHYRLGDLDLRVRIAGTEAWQDYATAFKRGKITALRTPKGAIASADITSALGAGMPLKVIRTWTVDKGQLVLRFTLSNPGGNPVEIGGLGIPMIFDNIISDRHLEDAHEQAAFYDPYVGKDGGYLQVTRLNGAGPALLVLPEKNTPFELYKPILDAVDKDGQAKIYNDPQRRNMTFEGFYDWMVASKGFADTDWKGVAQWNAPTSLILKPGETRTIGVRLVLSKSIRAIEDTLIANDRPVAVGIPGYIVPTDMPGTLFLHAAKPVKAIATAPEGALEIGTAQTLKDGWTKYVLTGKTAGRVRVSLTYADGSVQTVHYLVTKPESQVVADMGHFLTTKQWYENPSDPFHRSPSIMGYDRDTNSIITQDNRVWIAGLSDEGGAGSWLATIMKQLDNPDPVEVAKFEAFAGQTLWGQIQTAEGVDKYGVRKSVLFYDPATMPEGTYDPKLNWKVWSAWNREGAADLGRSYNYPHVAAAWWTLYRIGRYHQGLANKESWQTYLTRAAETTRAMMTKAPYYTEFGQMEGDVFLYILRDLKREGMTEEASAIEALMKGRADHWKTLKYPFGSEMPWDSTGQAEVYMWSRYFGDEKAAATTREVILAYDPTVPHWGYNGSARRFWDFLYAGKTSRIERQLHHYGSSLNAVPLFDAYRSDPADFHLLRAAYGGLMGSLTNVDKDGFGSAAFHSFPDAMHWDGMNGDYGMSFFGHAVSSASYLVKHQTFGWLGFGGNVEATGKTITLTPRDSARSRVFLAPAGLWLTLDAGKIERLSYSPDTGAVTVTLAPADDHTSKAYVNVATTTAQGRAYIASAPVENGAYIVELGTTETTLQLTPAKMSATK